MGEPVEAVRRALLLATALAALAGGCLGTPAAQPAPDLPPAAAPTLLAWTGHMRAGAAMEVPAHLAETAGAVRPLWSVGFQVHVDEAPQAMQATLAWTATQARILLMVVEPDDGDTLVIHETAPSEASPLCIRLPAEALRPGVWNVMAHSQVAVDAALAFEVAMAGGVATVVDEPSAVPASEFAGALSGSERPEPLACDGAA